MLIRYVFQDMVRSLWICRLIGLFLPCCHKPGKTIFRQPDIAEAGIHVPERAAVATRLTSTRPSLSATTTTTAPAPT